MTVRNDNLKCRNLNIFIFCFLITVVIIVITIIWMSPFLSLSLPPLLLPIVRPLFVKLYSISIHLIGTCAHHHHGRSSIAFIEDPSPSLLPCLIHYHYYCQHNNFLKLSFIPISHICISLFSIFSQIFRTHQNCIFAS